MGRWAQGKEAPTADEVGRLVGDLARESARGPRARAARVDRISSRLAEVADDALPVLLARLDKLGDPGCVALARIGPGAFPGLVKELGSPLPTRRRLAARALSLSGLAAAVAPLRRTLDDGDASVRDAAWRGLETLGRTWTRRLRDGSRRDLAMGVLADIGAPAVWPLAHMLRDRQLGLFAAKTLGRIGEPAVQPALLVLTHARRSPEREAWDPAFSFAAAALVDIGGPALDPVAAVLTDREEAPDVRAGAAFVLGRMGETGASHLREALQDDDAGVRAAAAAALARLAA